MRLSFLKSKELKNAGWLIGGKVAQMILSLFVGVLSARFLGPSNYGLINYGNALASFCISLCTLGINSVIVKELIENPDKNGELLGTSIFMRLLSSLGSSVLVILVSTIIDYGDWETVAVVALCSISLLFHAFDTINYWFHSLYNSKISAIATFVAYVVTAAYKIILLILQKSIFWFAFATSVDYIALGIVLVLCYKKANGPKFKISIKTGKNILGKSYHYILSGIMVAIYGQTDKLMLKQMLDEESVGYYSVAIALCSMWTFVLVAVIDAMYPTIVNSFKENKVLFEKRNRQLYAIVFYLCMFVSIGFWILGDFAINVLYGKEFAPAALPLKVVTWYTAFSYLGSARSAWMVCTNNQKYIKIMYIPAIFINIVLNLICIPLWGATGAAVASLVTQLSTSLLLPMCFKELRPNTRLMLEAITLKKIR